MYRGFKKLDEVLWEFRGGVLNLGGGWGGGDGGGCWWKFGGSNMS